jgi:hypothetical protein
LATHEVAVPNPKTAAPAIRLGGYDFAFVASLDPVRDPTGAIAESSPQARYANAGTVPLHTHGRGPFCKVRIAVQRHLAGVYALVVDGAVRYVGECEDLGKRFNAGYGNISPRNCYDGGQPTNCKVNRRVLDVARAGGRVDLYFHPTPARKAVEAELLAICSPPWNGRVR